MSRPLRAFAFIITCWTLTRIAMLWHVPIGIALQPAQAKLAEMPRLVARTALSPPLVTAFSDGSITVSLDDVQPVSAVPSSRFNLLVPTGSTQLAARLSILLEPAVMLEPATPAPAFASVPPLATPNRTGAPRTGRLSGSTWALVRPDSAGAALGTGGTLGGSQAGARFFYRTGLRSAALTARLSAPLAMRTGKEASVGVALRGRSIGILLERRIALDRGGRNAMSVTAYGGVGDIALPHGFVLDGYAQFGIVGMRSRDRFGDGALRILHPMIRSDAMKLSAGGSISGGFQPGVSRLDIGPELVVDLPVAATQVRVSAGWRQRIAGNAAPGSGPSLSVGFGF